LTADRILRLLLFCKLFLFPLVLVQLVQLCLISLFVLSSNLPVEFAVNPEDLDANNGVLGAGELQSNLIANGD
jgi:hypothetical protein